MKLKGKLLILFLIVLIAGLGFWFYNNKMKTTNTITTKKVSDSIEGYGYTLDNNKSEIYKKYFKQLKEVLSSDPVDENKYLELISKMLIIDLYSLDNKIDNNDIGGVEFVYSGVVDNYKAKMADTIYMNIESNLYGKRKQKLPMVKDVTVDDVKTVPYYYLNGKSDNSAYQVKVSWEYQENMGYDRQTTLYFVHENNKLSLVEMK